MLKNDKKAHCGFEDEIVSYMYNEMNAEQCEKFETHLADCSFCTDEFAGVSIPRLSVFEWQRAEFADLPTPEIIIPFEQRPDAIAVSLSATIRGWLSGWNVPVAAAAGLAVCLGLGFLVMNYLRSEKGQIASSNISSAPIEQPKQSLIPPVETSKKGEIKASVVTSAEKSARPIKAVVHRRTPITNNTRARNEVTPSITNIPRLSNDVDNDDHSLRLSELFDDVGG